MAIKITIFTYRHRVSFPGFSFCWCRHNRLLMTSQWPDNCDTITSIVISNSLDIDFIYGDIHGQSCKKTCYPYRSTQWVMYSSCEVTMSVVIEKLQSARMIRGQCSLNGSWWCRLRNTDTSDQTTYIGKSRIYNVYKNRSTTYWAREKMDAILQATFLVHFLLWKLEYFDSSFMECYSLWFN